MDPRRPDLRDDREPNPAERGRRLEERLRAAFAAGQRRIAGVVFGRGLTRAELERVLQRYRGDL